MTDRPIQVLSIEDQEDIQTVLRYSLEADGVFSVTSALNGATGIELAQSNSPDLIILDYSLPDMDGPEVLDRLKSSEITKEIPVVMLTAKTGDIDIEDCKRRGALEILIKPFIPQEIGPNILKILESTQAK